MNESVTYVNDGISLIQKDGGHLFGTDAYLLSAFVRPAPGKTAAELGAGSGIISLLCAQKGRFAHIDAVEVQSETAELAVRNVKLNGLEDKITVHCADVREYRGAADAVFTNPPYIRSDAGVHNPDSQKNASRRELFGGIGDFTACAARLMQEGGAFFCVWRPDRLADLFESMRVSGIEPKRLILVFPEPSSAPCLALVEGRRGGRRGSLFVAPPFVLNENGIQTADCRLVYEKGEFGERFIRP